MNRWSYFLDLDEKVHLLGSITFFLDCLFDATQNSLYEVLHRFRLVDLLVNSLSHPFVLVFRVCDSAIKILKFTTRNKE